MNQTDETLERLKNCAAQLHELLKEDMFTEEHLESLYQLSREMNEQLVLLRYLQKRKVAEQKSEGSKGRDLSEAPEMQAAQTGITEGKTDKSARSWPFYVDVNQKIMFTKELFAGDERLFHQLMELIAQAESIEDVRSYINSKYDWKPDHYAVRELMQLIEQKFDVG